MGLEAHHALPRRFLKDEAWRAGLRGLEFWREVYSPSIGIALPHRVHERHTNRVEVVPYEALPASLTAYVAARWGQPGLVALEAEHPRRSVAS